MPKVMVSFHSVVLNLKKDSPPPADQAFSNFIVQRLLDTLDLSMAIITTRRSGA